MVHQQLPNRNLIIILKIKGFVLLRSTIKTSYNIPFKRDIIYRE